MKPKSSNFPLNRQLVIINQHFIHVFLHCMCYSSKHSINSIIHISNPYNRIKCYRFISRTFINLFCVIDWAHSIILKFLCPKTSSRILLYLEYNFSIYFLKVLVSSINRILASSQMTRNKQKWRFSYIEADSNSTLVSNHILYACCYAICLYIFDNGCQSYMDKDC